MTHLRTGVHPWQRQISTVAQVLLIAGGLNWLLIGLADLNLIDILFSGRLHVIADVLYTLVGIAAFWMIYDQWSAHPGRHD